MGLCYHSFSETPAESCDLCKEIAALKEALRDITSYCERYVKPEVNITTYIKTARELLNG